MVVVVGAALRTNPPTPPHPKSSPDRLRRSMRCMHAECCLPARPKQAQGSHPPRWHPQHRHSTRKKGRMLWVDRYRPKTLATLDYHEDLTARLQALVSPGCMCVIVIGGVEWDKPTHPPRPHARRQTKQTNTGAGWGDPAPAVLRPAGRREEDAHHGAPPRDLRRGRGEGGWVGGRVGDWGWLG